MVKNTIKVYARLKQEDAKQKIGDYKIQTGRKFDEVVFKVDGLCDYCINKPNTYKFHKVFDQTSTQVEVFDKIAKPVVNSAINGYNATIFAYGQTGSGKTYAITGSSEDYDQRGIIPRSIEQIFKFTYKSPDKCSIYISYLEIYNDVGYDLLNPKHHATRLEELPRVILLQDAKGESHLRNLSVLPVYTEEEAMRLLFLGDTNRTIAETSMNEYSSRSHCIFTIYISTKSEKTNKLKKSKLHLVDLAGSECIRKSNISGTILNEAKHINLSLHYLEQVILALSQTNRTHIPYRNSMMTYMLRDSLSGNCLTIMLATLTLKIKNIDETITTCKFSQRVALINTEACINEEIDPQQEISYLKQEVDELRRQLLLLKGINVNEKLTQEEENNCRNCVKRFLNENSEDIQLEGDMRQIKFCFNLMKEAVEKTKCNNKMKQKILKYKEQLKEKEDEISLLKLQLENQKQEFSSSETNLKVEGIDLTIDEEKQFEIFLIDPKNRTSIDFYNQKLEEKYNIAKIFSETIEQCQKNIINLKKKIELSNNNLNLISKFNEQLISQQNIYRDSMIHLQNLKNEIHHLNYGLKKTKIKVLLEFKKWIQSKSDFRVKSTPQASQKFKSGSLDTKFYIKTHINEKYFDYCCNDKDWGDYGGRQNEVRCEINTPLNEKCMPLIAETNHNDMFKQCKSGGLTTYTVEENSCGTFDFKKKLPEMKLYHFNHNDINFQNSTSKRNRNGKLEELNTKNDGGYGIRDTNEEEKISNEEPETIDFGNNNRNSVNIRTHLEENRSLNSASSKLNNYKHFQKSEKSLYKKTDSKEFLEFMETVPLTGDFEVDDEIFNFYRSKFGIVVNE